MLKRKTLFGIALTMMLAVTITVLPTHSWVGPPYTPPGGPTPTEDYNWEAFGPRVRDVLIQMYGSDAAEFAALGSGQIDMMERMLTPAEYTQVSSGSMPDVALADLTQLDMYVLDIRNSPYINNGINLDIIGDLPEHSGQPGFPDLTDSRNPFGDLTIIVVPAGHPYLAQGTLVTRGSQARLAVAHLIDRAAIISLTGVTHNPIYTHMPDHPLLAGWINPAAMQYPFNPLLAALILDLAGYLDTDGDSVRNFDSDGDGDIDPADANFVVDFWTGMDLFRNAVGTFLTAQMIAVGLQVNNIPFVDGQAEINVKNMKIGHLLTGYHTLSREPTIHFWLYYTAQYWHPGVPPNYMRVSDPVLDYYAAATAYATSLAVAQTASWDAQARMNEPDFVGSIPLANSRGGKAYWKWYNTPTNTEYWRGIVNSVDQGINTGSPVDGRTGSSGIDTLLNAHGDNNPTGGTLRYGWRYADKPLSLNPFQYETFYDTEVIFRTYTGLVAVNPYDPFPVGAEPGQYPPGDVPWQALSWNIVHSVGTTQITFKLREDVYFHDGTKMTAKDVFFTVQFGHWQAIDHPPGWKALPPTWWGKIMDLTPEFNPVTGAWWDNPGDGVDMPNGPNGNIVVFNYNVQSIWAFWWAGGIPIAPKHKWWDVFVPNPTGSNDFAPDPQMIGTGPFQVYPFTVDPPDPTVYVPGSYIRLFKNPTFFAKYDSTFHGTPGSSGVSISIVPPGYGDIYLNNPTGSFYLCSVIIQVQGLTYLTQITGITVPAYAWGVTAVPHLQAGTYNIWIYAWIPGFGMIFKQGTITITLESTLIGDIAGSTMQYQRLPVDQKVDWKDLSWFLRTWGQKAFKDP